jgi:hypothetical protein
LAVNRFSIQLIQAEKAPKIYSYTFRQGRELPSFHESTISLHSEMVPRFLDSIVEEDVVVHRSAHSPPPAVSVGPRRVSQSSSDTEKEEWQDPIEMSEPERQHHSHHTDSDGHNDTFCSTYSSSTNPSPRRRSQRAMSFGYFLSI